MSIKELIEQAMENEDFAKRYTYWVHYRKKTPDLEWLMPLLEEALGASYVREQAQKYIKSQQDATKE